MKSKIFVLFFIVLLMTVMALVACTPDVPLPDLVPANPLEVFANCNVDDSNNLIVYVKNQGEADAPVSWVKVQFGLTAGVQDVSSAIVAIPAGETKSVSFAFPFGCFNPDCNFTITVDSMENIVESDELNNTLTGYCIG
jgi:subtilase family serine protease